MAAWAKAHPAMGLVRNTASFIGKINRSRLLVRDIPIIRFFEGSASLFRISYVVLRSGEVGKRMGRLRYRAFCCMLAQILRCTQYDNGGDLSRNHGFGFGLSLDY